MFNDFMKIQAVFFLFFFKKWSGNVNLAGSQSFSISQKEKKKEKKTWQECFIFLPKALKTRVDFLQMI